MYILTLSEGRSEMMYGTCTCAYTVPVLCWFKRCCSGGVLLYHTHFTIKSLSLPLSFSLPPSLSLFLPLSPLSPSHTTPSASPSPREPAGACSLWTAAGADGGLCGWAESAGFLLGHQWTGQPSPGAHQSKSSMECNMIAVMWKFCILVPRPSIDQLLMLHIHVHAKPPSPGPLACNTKKWEINWGPGDEASVVTSSPGSLIFFQRICMRWKTGNGPGDEARSFVMDLSHF